MTLKKPNKPVDSSSVGGRGAFGLSPSKCLVDHKRVQYIADLTFLIHGHWGAVNSLQLHTGVSEHVQLCWAQSEAFMTCRKAHKPALTTIFHYDFICESMKGSMKEDNRQRMGRPSVHGLEHQCFGSLFWQ